MQAVLTYQVWRGREPLNKKPVGKGGETDRHLTNGTPDCARCSSVVLYFVDLRVVKTETLSKTKKRNNVT